jgi:multimeric flavodoxin WrbA
MEKVKILGIIGSPRKNGNTAKLVDKALEAASAQSVAKRVAEMARIVKAGKAALGEELSSDYSYTWELTK